MARLATCHPDRKVLARGLCASCYAHQPDIKERIRRYTKSKRWKESQARYSSSSKGRLAAKRRRIRNGYGITLERYEEMLLQQGGVCAICSSPPRGRNRLAVDHCHGTGRIRGLLCIACNLVLGNAKDNPKTLRTAAMYIEASYADK